MTRPASLRRPGGRRSTTTRRCPPSRLYGRHPRRVQSMWATDRDACSPRVNLPSPPTSLPWLPPYPCQSLADRLQLDVFFRACSAGDPDAAAARLTVGGRLNQPRCDVRARDLLRHSPVGPFGKDG